MNREINIARVRSLLMGLYRWEKRMSLFIGASDETGGANLSALFTCGGFVAPSTVWVNRFILDWQTKVLDGPPSLPYFHFKEWREPAWRAKYSLDETGVENRIDEAVRIIVGLKNSAYWISQTQPQQVRRDIYEPILKRRQFSDKIVQAQLNTSDFDSNVGYILNVLDWVNEYHPECSSVDFYVSATQATEKLIGEWRKVRTFFKDHEESHRFRLMGELVPFELSEDKPATNYLPIQAADLHLWLIQRSRSGLPFGARDRGRLDLLASVCGYNQVRTAEEIIAQAKRFEAHADGNDGIM